MKKEVFTEPELRVESFRVQEAIMAEDWSDSGEGDSEEGEVSFPEGW